MKDGLLKLRPDARDYSLLHTFGGIAADPDSISDTFSVYSGQVIPDQNENDTRFPFLIPPLPYGCTGEGGAFDSGIQDSELYNPQDLYLNTPPGGSGGRDMRAMLQTLINRGPRLSDGSFGAKRTAYFNCYGAGAIDDFDAVRIAVWLNQYEKRGVYIGSYWYWGDASSAMLSMPASLNTAGVPLHCYLATGWIKQGSEYYLEVIPWLGMERGDKGRFYMSREVYNALMGQPYTGAFTITKTLSQTPVPIGAQAVIDHLVYFVRSLFHL